MDSASHFLSPCTKQCKVTHDDDCAVRIRCYLKAGYVHLLIGRAVGGIPVGGIDTLAWVSSTNLNTDRNMKHDCFCISSGRPHGGYCSFMMGTSKSTLSFSFCLTTCIFSSSY